MTDNTHSRSAHPPPHVPPEPFPPWLPYLNVEKLLVISLRIRVSKQWQTGSQEKIFRGRSGEKCPYTHSLSTTSSELTSSTRALDNETNQHDFLLIIGTVVCTCSLAYCPESSTRASMKSRQVARSSDWCALQTGHTHARACTCWRATGQVQQLRPEI